MENRLEILILNSGDLETKKASGVKFNNELKISIITV